MIALRDGVPLRDALDRLGVDTAPLDLPPPPEAVPFAHVAPGGAFTWQGHAWTRAALHQALAATPDRARHPVVVAAYLAATQRGRAATAFRWASAEDAEAGRPACLAERVGPDEPVTPVASGGPPTPPALPNPAPWVSTADEAPALGRPVTVDAPSGPVAARLLLDDEAAGGAAWLTAHGALLDLDDVPRWRP